MFSSWNSAKADNCTTLPSNVSYYYFCPQISMCYVYLFFIHIGEKRLGTSEDTTNPTLPKEEEIPKPQAEDEEGVVYEVGKILTTTGHVDVVEEESHLTSESAEILFRERMGCNLNLENIKENINDVQQKMKNIIDVLGRI
ncbi:hypothetical protein AB205_0010620 [Aquarana catesbeiana]|uniref:Uncharacterized protein n=1 Tax=Aquarana catesbeiana TaxID=8400 RepID=A0A2G9QI23_AQUCT|nr:hypothetical protein AB205_0010620 [Aquarana catesbeiana]